MKAVRDGRSCVVSLLLDAKATLNTDQLVRLFIVYAVEGWSVLYA